MFEITDNKNFWKTMKPFLSKKAAFSKKISLKEGEKIVSDDTAIAKILNKSFAEAVRHFSDKSGCSKNALDDNSIEDSLSNISHRSKTHPSIIAINRETVPDSFDFQLFTEEEVSIEILKVNQKKSSTGLSIGLLKENLDICAPTLTKIFNSCSSDGTFPNELKLADITPIFESADSTAKKNYRPISILNSVPKLFEKLIQRKLDQYFSKKLNYHLCGYRKRYATYYALLKLIENWKKIRDERGYSAVILMDLSKAFGIINHNPLIAKLYAYGLRGKSLKS